MASEREYELAYKLAERKLDRLDREYEMCVNARPSLPPEEEESSAGWNALNDSENEDDSVNPVAVPDSAFEDDEVWGSFQSAQDYEQAHGSSSSSSTSTCASSESSTSSSSPGSGLVSTTSESKVLELRPIAPLSSAQISTIKSTMAGLDLKVPAWAQRIPESEWLGKIISSARAQQAARASQSTPPSSDSGATPSSSSSTVSTESTEGFQPDFSTHDWTSTASSSSSSSPSS